jgi:hypothetical protein
MSLFLLTTIAVVLLVPASLYAQIDLEYQKRGNYYEGVRPKPVSGYDVEVISAVVDFQEPAQELPGELHVLFYLESPIDVHLTVREQDYRLFYWLDKAKLPRAWQSHAYNEFVWPSGNVLKKLDQKLNIYELGVLVRLGQPAPSQVERMAPAIFYHARAPTEIPGYLFSMKTNDDARLSCSLYREGSETAIMTEVFRRIPGGRPFTVRLGAANIAEGHHALVCKGFFLETNKPIHQTIRFYHRVTTK